MFRNGLTRLRHLDLSDKAELALVVAIVVLAAVVYCQLGCASNNARQIAAAPPTWTNPSPAVLTPTSQPVSQPTAIAGDVETTTETTLEYTTNQQSGQANLVAELRAQVDAAVVRADKLEAEINAIKLTTGDVKGIEYNSTLPIGMAVIIVFQMLLNAFNTYLSHRREKIRISESVKSDNQWLALFKECMQWRISS